MYQYQMLSLLNLIAGVTNSLKMSPSHPGMFRPFQGPCRWCRVSMASASLRNIDLEQSGRKKDEKGSWIMRYLQFYTRSRYTLHLIPPFQTDPTYFEPKISEISIWGSLSSSWSSPTFWLPVWDLNFWTFFNVDETWMSFKKATWATLWLSTRSTGLSTVISSNFASDARLSDCHRLSYFNGLFGSSSFPSKAGDVSTNAPRRTRFMAHGTVRFRLIRHERLPRTSGFLSTRLSRCNTGESLDILQMYRHQTETNLMNFNDLCNDMCLWQLLPQPFHHCFARETRAMAFVQVRALPVTGSFVRSEGLSLSPKRPQQRLGWNRQMKDSAIYNFVRIFSCSCFVQQYLAHDVSRVINHVTDVSCYPHIPTLRAVLP